MNKYIFTLFIGLFLAWNLAGQTFPKTIFEMYDIPKGGCSFELSATGSEEMEEMLDMAIDEATPLPPPISQSVPPKSDEETVREALAVFKKELANFDDLSTKETKDIKNGNRCFFKDGKWGLQDSLGKEILSPQFDYVKIDTSGFGFVGYHATKGNFYDANTGKKMFAEDYYHIDPIEPETFIVSTLEGFGILRKGKMVLGPNMQTIRAKRSKHTIYYSVTNEKDQTFLFLNDYKTKIKSPAYNSPTFSGDQYLYDSNNIYDLKTKTKLICGPGIALNVINPEKELVLVKKYRESFYFLSDFQGNIISETPFVNIGQVRDEDFMLATVSTNEPGQSYSRKTGLIDDKGQWIVEPTYQQIYKVGNYLLAGNNKRKAGLINSKGKVLLPLEYDFIHHFRDDLYLCSTGDKTNRVAKIMDVSTGKIFKDKVPYKSISLYKKCDDKYYIVDYGGEEQLLDKDLKPVTDKHRRIFHFWENMQGYDSSTYPNVERKTYDCDCNTVYLDINGEKIEKYKDAHVINEELAVYTLLDDRQFLVSKNKKAILLEHKVKSSNKANLGPLLILGADKTPTGILDPRNGKIMLPFIFKTLTSLRQDTGLFNFRLKKDRAGLMTKNGDLLNDRLYDYITYVGFGLYLVTEDEKKGLIHKNGETILPMIYDRINLGYGFFHAFQGSTKIRFGRLGKRI